MFLIRDMDKKENNQRPPQYIEVHGKQVKVIMRQWNSRYGYVHRKVIFGKEDCCYVVCRDGEYGNNLYKFERKNGKVRAFRKEGPGEIYCPQYPESNDAYQAALGGTIVDPGAWDD